VLKIVLARQASGRRNSSRGRIAAVHGSFSRIYQVALMCTPDKENSSRPRQQYLDRGQSLFFSGLGANPSLSFHPSPPLCLRSRSLSLFPVPCPSLPSFLPSITLEVDPLNPARGFGERCLLPQLGLGRSPSQPKSNLVYYSFKI